MFKLIVILALTTAATAASCNYYCTEQYEPVCAFDGSNYSEFSNKCFMGLGECRRGNNFVSFERGSCNVVLQEAAAEPENMNLQAVGNKFHIQCKFACVGKLYTTPVCGYSEIKNEYKLFENICVMGIPGCIQNPEYTKVDIENCPET